MHHRTVLSSIIGLILILIAGLWYAYPLLRIGSGYAAKMGCSCHFLQGRELADIHEKDLNFSVLPWMRLQLNAEKRQVTAAFLGIMAKRVAEYVPGRGCILISNPTMELPAPWVESEAVANDGWPMRLDTLPPGIDTLGLQEAGDAAFAPLAGGGTRALLVLYDGKLVYERYAVGFGPQTPLLGWSMTKSLTNALVGMLVKQGRLDPDAKNLFPAWAGDDRRNITLRNLLQMNSGLVWNENYGNTSDATVMLYVQPDMPGYAASVPLAQTPGTTWVYSSGTSNLLSGLVRQQFTDDRSYQSFIRDSLFAALGMTSARIEPDQAGTAVGSSYGWATARDWARFGQLYLQDGVWEGRQLLPPGWVAFSREPAAGSENTYGGHIWLKDIDTPNAPADIFQFSGFQDQRVCIIPSRRVVMVRLGMNDDKQFGLDAWITGVLAALPTE